MTHPSVHGGLDFEELAVLDLRPDRVVDFSANVNPFGPSPAVREAARRVPLDRYPDRDCRELRHALARRHGVPLANVLVGNGSTELLWLLAVARLRPGDRVVILGPTFSESEHAARTMGAEVVVCRASPEEDFRPPVHAFAAAVARHRPKLVFATSPNNPTGRRLDPAVLPTLAARHPDTRFVLDEAYADCLRHLAGEPDPKTNVLRLRSLTKAHGLAGLRLGYLLGPETELAAVRAVQPPWSVNAVAQAAGCAALRDDDHHRDTLARWWRACDALRQRLTAEGFRPVDSDVPFFLLSVPYAAVVRHHLLRQGLLVRDGTSFGLPRFVRISGRTDDENAALVRGLVACRREIASWAD